MGCDGRYIAATSIYLPDPVSLDDDITGGSYPADEAARTRMISYTRAADGASSLELATRAAHVVLNKAPEERDYLLALYYSFVGHPGGPPAWNAAAKIHQLLHLENHVIPLGITMGCAAGLAAIGQACHLLEDDHRGSVLVLGSEAWSPNQVDVSSARGLILADGASAVLISNDSGFAAILATDTQCDSRLADSTRGAEPLQGDPAARVDLAGRFNYFSTQTTAGRNFHPIRDALRRAVLESVLAKADLRLDEIDAFCFTFSGAGDLETGYFRLFPIAQERINTMPLGLRIGHLGTADWITGLHLLREDGSIKAGQNVILMGGGGGWMESAVALRVLA